MTTETESPFADEEREPAKRLLGRILLLVDHIHESADLANHGIDHTGAPALEGIRVAAKEIGNLAGELVEREHPGVDEDEQTKSPPAELKVLSGPGAQVILVATYEVESLLGLLRDLADVDASEEDDDRMRVRLDQIRSTVVRLGAINSAVMSIADPTDTKRFADLCDRARTIASGASSNVLGDHWPRHDHEGATA